LTKLSHKQTSFRRFVCCRPSDRRFGSKGGAPHSSAGTSRAASRTTRQAASFHLLPVPAVRLVSSVFVPHYPREQLLACPQPMPPTNATPPGTTRPGLRRLVGTLVRVRRRPGARRAANLVKSQKKAARRSVTGFIASLECEEW